MNSRTLFRQICRTGFARRTIHGIEDLPERRLIRVEFRDGKFRVVIGINGLFPYVWLRDCSNDPTTYTINASIKARIPMMHKFDVDVTPDEVILDRSANSLIIRWPLDVVGRYDAKWLRTRNLSDGQVRARRRRFHLDAGEPWNEAAIRRRLKRFDHSQFLTDDRVLHDFLSAVCEDGIAFLVGGPTPSENAMERVLDPIGDRIGLIFPTHFGEKFEVTTKAEASNLAYASGDELPYHTDFTSLTHPPELQLLHSVQSADEGGLSMFVDGFKIAELMKANHLAHYQTLTETKLEFFEEGYDTHVRGDDRAYRFYYDMVAPHKTICTDSEGHVTKVHFGNAMRSWFIDEEPGRVQSVYDALKAFTTLCYRPENQLIFQLNNGESVLWANTRVLHARSAYRSAPERERLLVGCYFAWDIVKSRVRVIRDQLNLPDNQPSI